MAHPSSPIEFNWSWARAGISLGLIALIALILIGIYVLFYFTNPQPRERVVGETAYRVATQPLQAEDVAEQIRVSGQVLAARQVDLRPLTSGRVVWVSPELRDGGRLSQGDPVLRLDDSTYRLNLRQAENAAEETRLNQERLASDVERQRTQLDLQRAQLALAEEDLGRRADLLAEGIISQSVFDQVESSTLAQRQSLTSAENALAQLEEQLANSDTSLEAAQLNVDLAQQNLENTELTAPFSGLVLASAVQEGQVVSQGDLAARLIDQSGLEVQFRLTQDLFASLSTSGGLTGKPAEVSWDGQLGDTALIGTITRQGSSLDPSAGGVPLFLSLDQEAFAAGLRPGAFVEVALTGQDFGAVYAVPRDAYFPDLEGGQGGIYVTEDRPLINRPEWQGPTSRLALRQIDAWLADQPVEGLAAVLMPADLADTDEETALSDLFTCKPFRLRGEGGGPTSTRNGGGGRNGPGATGAGPRGPGAGRGGRGGQQASGASPELSREQGMALCPPTTQTVAVATPVSLLTFSGDLALISPLADHRLEGLTAVTQRFDRLADGTWLTLEGSAQ